MGCSIVAAQAALQAGLAACANTFFVNSGVASAVSSCEATSAKDHSPQSPSVVRPIRGAYSLKPDFRMARIFSASSEIRLTMSPYSSGDNPSSGGPAAPPGNHGSGGGDGKGSKSLSRHMIRNTLINLAAEQGLIPDELADKFEEQMEALVEEIAKKAEMIERSGKTTSVEVLCRQAIRKWKDFPLAGIDKADAAYARYVELLHQGKFKISDRGETPGKPHLRRDFTAVKGNPWRDTGEQCRHHTIYQRFLTIEKRALWPGTRVRHGQAVKTIRHITRDCRIVFEGNSAQFWPTGVYPVKESEDS